MSHVDISQFVPEKTLTGQKIETRLEGNHLELWTMLSKGGKSSKLRINRFAEADQRFWIGLGLLIAEGTKPGRRNKDKGRIAITNTDPKVINNVLHLFERLGIQRNLWKGVISANSFYIHDKGSFMDRARKYWSKRVKIPVKKISIALYHRQPRRKRRTALFGTLQVRLESVILNSVIQDFIKKCYA